MYVCMYVCMCRMRKLCVWSMRRSTRRNCSMTELPKLRRKKIKAATKVKTHLGKPYLTLTTVHGFMSCMYVCKYACMHVWMYLQSLVLTFISRFIHTRKYHTLTTVEDWHAKNTFYIILFKTHILIPILINKYKYIYNYISAIPNTIKTIIQDY